ncbi:thiolase family protein [Jiulongibacter sp. NS-SX5]|uniref:thiolase family protein n=1 Tax=Jiulongibacter sp. NS-SX5 TaxID=3463854 RepID=UPI00405970F3
MSDLYIYDLVRVPTGKRGGYYKTTPPEELASFLIDRLIARNPLLSQQEVEVLIANSIGTMGNMARYTTLLSKLPEHTKASTIDLQCGGSYQALRLAQGLVNLDANYPMIIGGMESNSLKPFRSYHQKDPRKKTDQLEVADFDPSGESDLMKAASELALKFNLQKEELLDWTLESQKKAFAFSQSETYNSFVLDPFGKSRIDQTINENLTPQSLRRASSSKLNDSTNTAHYHDGASLALVSGSLFDSKPLAKIKKIELIGIPPGKAPEGALIAVEKLIQTFSLKIEDIDLFEVNESFGAKALAFSKYFKVDPNKINILGGNLAYGHPYSASGMMNLMHLVFALKQKRLKFGVVSAGIAGGFGAAVLVENIE